MARTFNCGIGMVLVVAGEDAAAVVEALSATVIGRIEAGVRGCDVAGAAGSWGSDSAWTASHDA